MKYLIWGAGRRGTQYKKYFKDEELVAYVDNDIKKIGTFLEGKRVISFSEYLLHYRDHFLIIGMIFEKQSVEELKQLGINNYILFSECPGEYQEFDYHPYLKTYLNSIIEKECNYLIYGCSLYAIQLNELIFQKTGKYAPIMINKSFSKDRAAAFIKTINGEMPVIKYSSNRDTDCVLAACEDKLDDLQNMIGIKCPVINVFDCSDRIEEYHNKAIEKYRNLYEGQNCFIVATGPSLRMDDLEMLKRNKIPCFSMNSIWKAFELTSWRPTYYMAEDWRIYDLYSEFLKCAGNGIEMMFLADTNDNYWKKNSPNDPYLKYHLCTVFSEYEKPKFSEDMSRRSYEGGTVTYSCMQMAAYMGFKNIYLLGTDYTNKKNNQNAKYGHFYSEEKLKSISYDNGVQLAYEKAKEFSENHGISIYNATRGGYLDIFERVDFDSLFDQGVFNERI